SAIEMLSDALSREVSGTDVQVSCIQPGLVKKGLHDRWEVTPDKGADDQLEPEDIARMVLFILEQPQAVAVPPENHAGENA
ncbi:MAG: hypothetical protein WCD70_09255, partial [Alphaproteobacteria bacterium]